MRWIENQDSLAQISRRFYQHFSSCGYSVVSKTPLVSPYFPSEFNMSAAHGTVNRIVNDRAWLDHPEHFQVVETCLRHNDISAVSDGIHLSLFHMAAFGVGAPRPNLDKKGVFRETLDFLVGIGIPKNSLFFTVFAGGNIAGRQYRRDEESLTILAELGIGDGQIGLVRG